jgi:hypothetical protein
MISLWLIVGCDTCKAMMTMVAVRVLLARMMELKPRK